MGARVEGRVVLTVDKVREIIGVHYRVDHVAVTTEASDDTAVAITWCKAK